MALTAYGQSLGLAFQIADDLLDVEGSSSDIGKTAGSRRGPREGILSSRVRGGRREETRARAGREAKEAIAPFGLRDLEALADYVIERRR
jgi:hypothetical protein